MLYSHLALGALWMAWLTYWALASRDVKRTAWHESLASRASHYGPLLLAAIALGAPNAVPVVLRERFAAPSLELSALAIILVAAGLTYASWARIHLGRNWSAMVTVKEGHELVRSGPYAQVRHPIYSGIILAFIGTALEIGEWRGLIAAALAFIAFAIKSRIEDRRMAETFDDYAAYARTTSALIPGIY